MQDTRPHPAVYQAPTESNAGLNKPANHGYDQTHGTYPGPIPVSGTRRRFAVL